MPDQLPVQDATLLLVVHQHQPATVAEIQAHLEAATEHQVAQRSIRAVLERLRSDDLLERSPPEPYEYRVAESASS